MGACRPGRSSPANATTTVFPNFTQTFTVYVTDSEGCTASDDVTVVYVTQPPGLTAGPDRSGVAGHRAIHGPSTQAGSVVDALRQPGLRTCLNPTLKVVEPGWYVLQALDTTGCIGKDSVFVDMFYPVYVPNAFTPNNDGVNDVFKVEGEDIRGYWMNIFNRWGELVFTSDDPSSLGRATWKVATTTRPMACTSCSRFRIDNWDGPCWLEGHVTLFR